MLTFFHSFSLCIQLTLQLHPFQYFSRHALPTPGRLEVIFPIASTHPPVIEAMQRQYPSTMRAKFLFHTILKHVVLGFTLYQPARSTLQSTITPTIRKGALTAFGKAHTITAGNSLMNIHTASLIKSNKVGAFTAISASHRYERLSFQ